MRSATTASGTAAWYSTSTVGDGTATTAEPHQALEHPAVPPRPRPCVVVNMIVLWNTIYMQAALDQHRADGHSVRPEDEARLSPLGHEHINLLGRYSFAVPESVARGELRPLRNPADGGR